MTLLDVSFGLILGLVLGSWFFVRRRREVPGIVDLIASLFDNFFDGVVLIDKQDVVVYSNTAAFEMLSGNDFSSLPVVEEMSKSSCSAESGYMLEIPAGESLRCFWAKTSQEMRLVVLRYEAQSGSEALDQRRRDFVANASHELQTPIAALVGLLDLLADADESDGDEYKDNLIRRSQGKVNDLSSLTRDLIGLASADDADRTLVNDSVSLNSIGESILDRFQEKASRHNLSLRLEIGDEFIFQGSLVALETVLGNLIDNALSYTSEGEVVLVISQDSSGETTCEIRDTGSGIDASLLPRIFERFFRGDPARSRMTGGTGLGLSIVRNVVERMGGRISVSSSIGQGSRFFVHLPSTPQRPLAGAGEVTVL